MHAVYIPHSLAFRSVGGLFHASVISFHPYLDVIGSRKTGVRVVVEVGQPPVTTDMMRDGSSTGFC